MFQGLKAELWRIALIALTLVLIGLINGYLTEVLLAGGIAYMVWTMGTVLRLYQWLGHDARDTSTDTPPPRSSGIWGDISEQLYRLQRRNTHAKREFRSLAQRVRKITSALDEGLVILNSERGLDWWNPAAAKLLGLRREDRLQTITNLVRAPQFVHFINAETFDTPLELPAPSDPNRLIQCSARPFGKNELALIVLDITLLRQLEAMRKDFVANISHELRTPLTVLTGYIETLQQSGDTPSPTWEKALQQMAEQTKRMNLLAEDLVMLSRLESTVTPQSGPVSITELLKTIIDNAQMLSGGKHHFKLVSAGTSSLTGDHKELHSAFSNLVYNAVRHNPQGCSVTVEVTELAGQLSVSVRDNGVGIDPVHLPRLTERFYRADASRASHSGGTGLGLAIVKHVLLRHHGALSIDSELGKGASFTCLFETGHS